MEENKKNELEEISLSLDALTSDPEPQAASADERAAQETEEKDTPVSVEDTETPEQCDDEAKEHQEPPKVKEKKKKKERAPKVRTKREPKPKHTPAVPIEEPALPLLVCTVVFAISLIALVIDKFIFSFSQELLAPVILQLIALVIPAYLSMMITSADKSVGAQLKEIGFRAVRADHVFFMIFAALFACCGSLTLTLMLGGAPDASRGLTLLGTFTAGANEYTVSYPYLILTYVLLPAIAEEVLFRGVMFSRLERVSFPLAATLSCIASALYSFSLGGLIPAFFISAMMVFVLYTTNSIVCCIIAHLLINLYRLFLEANISAYFLSSLDNLLLLTTVAIALCISSLLFFSESARIFRTKSRLIAEGREKSAKKSEGFKAVMEELRSTVAFKPSLILSIVCLAFFAAAVTINLLK